MREVEGTVPSWYESTGTVQRSDWTESAAYSVTRSNGHCTIRVSLLAHLETSSTGSPYGLVRFPALLKALAAQCTVKSLSMCRLREK